MTDDKQKMLNIPGRGPSVAEENSTPSMAPVLQQVIQTMVALNICRKNLFSYPPEHDQIRQSMDRAFHALAVLLENRAGITLGVTGDSLIVELLPAVGDTGTLPTILPIDPNHVACRELARILKHASVATITIAAGIDMDELYRFLAILARPAEEIISAGGMTSLAFDTDLPSIDIRQVDYTRFHVTDEAEIPRKEKTDKRPSVWESFVMRLMTCEPDVKGKGLCREAAGKISPDQLARHINDNQQNADLALEAFEKAVTGYFEGHEDDVQGFVAGTWGQLIPGLSPAIMTRFLTILIGRLEKDAGSEQAAHLLTALPGNTVADMVNRSQREQQPLSPPLLSLIRDMAENRDAWPDRSAEIMAAIQSPFGNDSPSQGTDQNMSHRQQASDASMDAPVDAADESSRFDLLNILPTLDDAHLDIKIARLLIGFMNGNIDHDEYAMFADKLILICEALMAAGNFTLPGTVFNTFANHVRKKRDLRIREAAEKALQTLTGPNFAAKAVAAFLADETAAGKTGVEFLDRVGAAIVPELVKHYANQKTQAMTEAQQTLFKTYAATSSAEAQQRLDGTRPLFSRNLIVLLRTLKARESVDRLRPFLHHDNPELQTETLETLLQFGDAMALSLVRKMINARRSEQALRGIELAGKHRVSQLVPELVVKLKRFIVFKSDITMNRAIILALSQIGEPEALPWLKKVASVSWPFYTREITRMKVTLFKSLKHYPPEAAQPLLIMGRDMRDKEISMACHALMQQSAWEESK